MRDVDGWARDRGAEGLGIPRALLGRPKAQARDVGGSGDARGGRRPGPHTWPGITRYPGDDTPAAENEYQV